MREQLVWAPQRGPQTALLSCPIEDVLTGGARGGGKTDSILGDWLSHADRYGEHASGVLFRKHYKQFEEIVRRSRQIYLPLGWSWKQNPPTWTDSRTGATLKFRHLINESDADEYQGHSYTWLGAEEITNWSTPNGLDRLRATLRSAARVKCVFRATGNPGGIGHNWVKARYIDPAPPYRAHLTELKLEDGTTARRYRVFIPSRLEDNPALTKNDPQYWERVAESVQHNPALLKAWRWGIWDIVAGGMFDEVWRPGVHILEPFEIPATWRIDRSFDWGSSKPFSVGWWAESDGTQAPNGRHYPCGTLIRIAEYYGWNGRPNEGLRMTAGEIARRIKEIETSMRRTVYAGPADPSIFATENGNCIADDMARQGVKWEPADNSRKPGWQKLQTYLRASTVVPMEEPGLFVFNVCRQFIRTVPVLPRDERDPDDVDSESEDHPADETRYRVMKVKHTVRSQKLTGY